MRDKRFVDQHRGGPLGKKEHKQLIKWAIQCSEHVISLLGDEVDERLLNALDVARRWSEDEATVGDARKASVVAHQVARESSNQTAIYVSRSVGQAVATAHMADHSLGAAWYALKAVKSTGESVEAERKWQNHQLPLEIRELVLTARESDKFTKI
jgi:hypothetical protein